MRVLVLGGSGATGKLVVRQLLSRQIDIRMVIRASTVLSEEIRGNPLVEIRRGNINEFTESEINNLLRDCNAVISCLGHNITLKGMFGKPRYLVFDTIRNISNGIKKGTGGKV